MKKIYVSPAIQVTRIGVAHMLCGSIEGVDRTGNLNTSVSNDETEEYLSRRNNVWDD